MLLRIESTSTCLALKLPLFLLVHASHVTVVCGVRSKRASAVTTLKWLLAAVLADMRAQD